jgi:hypothetical protein
MIRAALFACALLAATGSVAGAEDAYETAVAAVMADPGAVVDYAELRRLYAASPATDGMSDMPRLRAATTQEGGVPATREAVAAAIAADFPLLETHYNAYQYFDWMGGPDAEAKKSQHFDHYFGLMKAILESERFVGGVRTFVVLSIGEEYEILAHLKLDSKMQALVNIEGLPYDRHDTAEGQILFDISAFFGK